jgi:hypothetical protein
MNFIVDGRSWKPSRAEANRADDKKWGDVAAPDIVGLQYNSREETIKTRSITLILSLMLLLFPEPPQQQNAQLSITSIAIAGSPTFSGMWDEAG